MKILSCATGTKGFSALRCVIFRTAGTSRVLGFVHLETRFPSHPTSAGPGRPCGARPLGRSLQQCARPAGRRGRGLRAPRPPLRRPGRARNGRAGPGEGPEATAPPGQPAPSQPLLKRLPRRLRPSALLTSTLSLSGTVTGT
jgi:hypothetical protein